LINRRGNTGKKKLNHQSGEDLREKQRRKTRKNPKAHRLTGSSGQESQKGTLWANLGKKKRRIVQSSCHKIGGVQRRGSVGEKVENQTLGRSSLIENDQGSQYQPRSNRDTSFGRRSNIVGRSATGETHPRSMQQILYRRNRARLIDTKPLLLPGRAEGPVGLRRRINPKDFPLARATVRELAL